MELSEFLRVLGVPVMWRRIALGFAALVVAVPAWAADAPRPVIVAPVIKAPAKVDYFSGLYVGVHGGWGWSNASSAYVNPPANCGPGFGVGCAVDLDPAGAFVGGQLGFNVVTGNGLMIGVEGDYSFASLHDRKVGIFGGNSQFGTQVNLDVDKLATIQARLGWVMGQMMPFVTVGYGWAHTQRSAFNPQFLPVGGTLDTRWHQGLTLGAGVEYAINTKWSVKGEYRFFNGNSQLYSLGFAGGTRVNLDIHTARFGINYNF